MLQRRIAAAIPFFAVLIVKHGVAVRERAASAIFTGDANADTFVDQRSVGEIFSHAPVERQSAITHRLAIGDHFLDARMQDEPFGHGGELFG